MNRSLLNKISIACDVDAGLVFTVKQPDHWLTVTLNSLEFLNSLEASRGGGDGEPDGY